LTNEGAWDNMKEHEIKLDRSEYAKMDVWFLIERKGKKRSNADI